MSPTRPLTCLGACLMTCLLAAADDAPLLHIDFEGEPAHFSRSAGEISEAEPIAGARSLRVDSRGHATDWFEYLTTEAGRLPPGFTYRATVRYRVLEAAGEPKVYLLFRSEGKGWGSFDRGWRSAPAIADGEVRTLETEVGLDNRSDYELMLGINGKAAIQIDDITITQGAPFHEASKTEAFHAAIPASAQRIGFLDFEADPVPGTLNAKASISDQDPIAGTRSLIGDTTASDQQWNIFYASERGWFKPDNRYYISFDYRVLGDEPLTCYLLIRSPAGHHVDVLLQRWKLAVGAEGQLTAKAVVYWPHDDYSLQLGTIGTGRIAIDDLSVVEEVRGPNEALAARPAFDPNKATLVFEDTFDGETLDPERWDVSGTVRRRGGMWRGENTFLDGEGNLVVRFDTSDGSYNGGCVTSKEKFRFGYFEARIKLNDHPGHWLGFWLMDGAVNRVGDDGRDGTEIDIVESPWRGSGKVSHALHWDGYGEDHRSVGHHAAVADLEEGYHTFAVDWFEHGYVFYVDGVETWRTYAGEVCQVPLSILFSDELGGWSGKADDATLPDDSLIDWVRVWRYGEDHATPDAATPAPAAP